MVTGCVTKDAIFISPPIHFFTEFKGERGQKKAIKQANRLQQVQIKQVRVAVPIHHSVAEELSSPIV
jgi:hypothetical protein